MNDKRRDQCGHGVNLWLCPWTRLYLQLVHAEMCHTELQLVGMPSHKDTSQYTE